MRTSGAESCGFAARFAEKLALPLLELILRLSAEFVPHSDSASQFADPLYPPRKFIRQFLIVTSQDHIQPLIPQQPPSRISHRDQLALPMPRRHKNHQPLAPTLVTALSFYKYAADISSSSQLRRNLAQPPLKFHPLLAHLFCFPNSAFEFSVR